MKLLRASVSILVSVFLIACGRSTPVVETPFNPDVYIVQSGDTVYSISWRYQRDFREVIRWNRLASPYTIYPGQELVINQGSRAAAPTAKPAAQTRPAETTVTTRPLKKQNTASTPQKLPEVAVQPAPGTPQPAANSGNNRWRWPVRGPLISSFSNQAIDRQGIDIKGTAGAPVIASRAGRVVYSGSGLLNYGRLVIVKHSETFLSAYAHNSQLLVKEGQTVKSGQKIALIGKDNKGVAKLHFEIRKDGTPVDPLKYLPRP